MRKSELEEIKRDSINAAIFIIIAASAVVMVFAVFGLFQ